MGEACLQRLSGRQTQKKKKVPADYVRQDQWCLLGYNDSEYPSLMQSKLHQDVKGLL